MPCTAFHNFHLIDYLLLIILEVITFQLYSRRIDFHIIIIRFPCHIGKCVTHLRSLWKGNTFPTKC